MEVETDTPYRSVRHAMSRALAGEERMICKSPTLMASRSTRSDMTPHDHAAQDAIVVSLIYSQCWQREIAAISAQYMPASLTMARGITLTKHGAISVCATVLSDQPEFAGVDHGYLTDLVREWAGIESGTPESEWSERLGKSPRMLRNIKTGIPGGGPRNRRAKPGVYTVLDQWLESGEGRLRPLMQDRDLIP